MTVSYADVTLGELVTAHPCLARELERWGLDYCCGGARTLSRACADAGVDLADVAAALATAAGDAPPEAWAAMDPAELVDHLEATHHQYLWAELPRLSALVGYQPPADGCGSYQACYRALAELEADTHLHVHKENNLLFPAVAELERRASGG